MKITFDGITIGGGSNYFLDDRSLQAFKSDVDNAAVRIPRSDFGTAISQYVKPKVRTISGTLVGDDVADFKTRKRVLMNELQKEFTFTIVDDTLNADGTTTIFETYEFTGIIIDVNANLEVKSNLSKFTIQIFSEDSRIFKQTPVNETAEISLSGFTFPLIFPFIFTGGNNVITVTNAGLVEAYPTITVTGGAVNLSVISDNPDLTDNIFKYNSTIPSGDDLVLTPVPTDPIKARLNGVSVIQFTNSNFDALIIPPDTTTTYTFFATAGIDANTEVNFTYQDAYRGI